MPDFPGYTDVSESTVFLALFGPKAFRVAEKLTNLDFLDPAKRPPFCCRAPFATFPARSSPWRNRLTAAAESC
jgi:hypothetical protein